MFVGQLPERSARVSTLELFFDLVFVFTITQLTGILAAGQDLTSAAQVVVLLLLIWWMYDGYAWLTNAIETERVRHRLLLMGGMGSFLVIALAAPYAFGERGLAFGLAYLIVVLLHSGMFVQGTSLSEIRAVLQLAPFNLIGAGLVLFGGATGGSAQWVMWIAAALLFWAVTPWLTTVEGFLVSPTHFVERHGLVIIIALGESVVVIGVGAAGMQLDANLVLVVLLALALAAALWWTYFRDESDVERAVEEAPPRRRNKLALAAFGYWHYGLLLGVVLVAAGLKKAVAVPYDPLDGWIAGELAGGVALFLVCDVGFRRRLGIPRGGVRFAAAPVCLLTIPLGTQMAGVAQVGALAAIVAGALVVEGSRVPARREPMVARLPPTVEQSDRYTVNAFADLSRGRMHYVSVGEAPGIVLLHGWPGFWFDYRHVLPRVAALGHAVAPDFFGFGDSEAVRGDPVTVAGEESLAGDMLELVDSLALDRVLVVGQDIGSAVAPALARLAPERVQGLVLLNPTHPYIGDKRYSKDAQRESWYQHFHVLPLAADLIDGDRRRVELYLSYFYEHWAGEAHIRPEELATVVDAYARPGALASSIAWYHARAAQRRQREPPAAIEVPTIALWGDRDPMRPLAHREGFETAFPYSTSRVLPGVGHFVAAEAPDAVVGAIAELLGLEPGHSTQRRA